jgi:hypothetical protein
MGSQGGRYPNGLKGREAHTLFLRAPVCDWALLEQDLKQEFRMPWTPSLAKSYYFTPTLVVLYCTPPHSAPKSCLKVLLNRHEESLIDISKNKDALQREGFDTYDHFRGYWKGRMKNPYDPLQHVFVLQIAPPTDHLLRKTAMCLLGRLYAEHSMGLLHDP